MADALPDGARRSRFWLFAPFVLLLLAAIGWTVAWFVIRDRAAQRLDAVLAREAAAGRQWTCSDRVLGGFPFRIEVACSTLGLQRGATRASFGRTVAVAQVYQPRMIIAEVTGPLHVESGEARVDAQWRLLQASVHLTRGGFQRTSLIADGASVRAAGLLAADAVAAAERLEVHVRPDPARFGTEAAYGVALSAAKAAVPGLNELVGGDELLDFGADAVLTRVEAFRGGPPAEQVERWRQQAGSLELTRVTLAKGARRLEAKGSLGIDDLHRATGRLELAAAGLEDVVARITGVRIGGTGGALLGTLLGGQTRNRPGGGEQKLAQLPTVRLENGRVLLGPLALPGVRLTPLY